MWRPLHSCSDEDKMGKPNLKPRRRENRRLPEAHGLNQLLTTVSKTDFYLQDTYLDEEYPFILKPTCGIFIRYQHKLPASFTLEIQTKASLWLFKVNSGPLLLSISKIRALSHILLRRGAKGSCISAGIYVPEGQNNQLQKLCLRSAFSHPLPVHDPQAPTSAVSPGAGTSIHVVELVVPTWFTEEDRKKQSTGHLPSRTHQPEHLYSYSCEMESPVFFIFVSFHPITLTMTEGIHLNIDLVECFQPGHNSISTNYSL